MAYNVQNTRTQTVLTLADNTIDSTYSIFLVGKNTPNYGDALNESLYRLLEHNASPSAPTTPAEGQFWYDTTNLDMKVWRVNGVNTGWVSIGRAAQVGAPSSLTAKAGDVWYDTSLKQLKIYNDASASWDVVGPDYSYAQGLSGQQIMTVVDTGLSSHYVIGWYINNTLFAIVSKDPTFSLTGYTGFTTINPGINFSTSFAVNLSGGSSGLTIDNALQLGGIGAAGYMRSNADTGSTGIVSLTNTTDSTVYTNGALVVSGGVGIAKSVNINGNAKISSGATSTSTTSGALQITGGVGISGNIYAGAIQNTPIGSVTRSTGAFTTLLASGVLTANSGTTSTSTSTGAVVITGGLGLSGNVNAGGTLIAGSINNTPIGNATPSTGAFTTLTASGQVTATGNIAASSYTTGQLVVTGGVGISGELFVHGDATFDGNVLVSNLTVGSLTATAVTVANINAAANYYVTFVAAASGSQGIGADGSANGLKYNPGTDTLYANLVSGVSTQAQYADLAEKYESDYVYEAGTVVIFGGEKEITTTNKFADTRVAGVISEAPAYLMNSEANGLPVALRGKVQVNVIGPVQKGDLLVTSQKPGWAQWSQNEGSSMSVFAKALESAKPGEMKKIYAVIV